MKSIAKCTAAAAALTLCSSVAGAAVFTLDVSGVESWDGLDSPNNAAFVIDLAAELGFASGTTLIVDAVGFDVTIDSLSPLGTSWLSEATVALERTDLTDGLFLAPGIGNDFSGVDSFSSSGLIDLAALDLDFRLQDGLLSVQFFEGFDDAIDAIDAIWLDGTIDISARVIPLPAAVWLFAGGLLALGGLRRRA